jgi:outer membrane receptor protein involved in Fe transport
MKNSVSIRLIPSRLRPLNHQNLKRALLLLASLAVARSAVAQSALGVASGSSTNVVSLGTVKVVGQLDEAREQIVPSLGATSYSITADQIGTISQGVNAGFNEVLLRAPGMAQDSFGQVHLRGEHANLQYRINDVILPEGITGFGSELDTRFVDSVSVVTGALPAQYGFRTAGVVDIHTRSGAVSSGGELTLYGGSYDTLRPSAEFGGSTGKLIYFANASYLHSGIGIENPTGMATAIHDKTDQYKAFSYLSYVLDDTSRVGLIMSGSYSNFQIPDNPGQTQGNDPAGNPFPVPGVPNGSFSSSNLNETQNEQNYYGVISYQKAAGDLNYQLAAYGRSSTVLFRPDQLGDLYFNGVATRANRKIYSTGFQGDFSYAMGDSHTLRGGATVTEQIADNRNTTSVFAIDGAGNATGAPFSIVDQKTTHALLYGIYLQDEWKVAPKFTLNYGVRFDVVSSFIHENQVSPRLNAIYNATDSTTLHAGYARYFTPPPLELVQQGNVNEFTGTSNEPAVKDDTLPKSERAHYFDAGITHKFTPEIQVGLDSYYKIAHDQIDEGQFGAAIIESPFNYRVGRIYGSELSASYNQKGFSSYFNLAYSVAQGKNLNTAQFLFSQDDLDYTAKHYIFLDHDQRLSSSIGVSYLWEKTRFYADALYGTGLRKAGDVPNGASLPQYYTINAGVEQSFKLGEHQTLRARVDVVNVTDNVYKIRDGSGIGVGAPQFGMRRGIFGSFTFAF